MPVFQPLNLIVRFVTSAEEYLVSVVYFGVKISANSGRVARVPLLGFNSDFSRFLSRGAMKVYDSTKNVIGQNYTILAVGQ
jgi:hypothetical protein